MKKGFIVLILFFGLITVSSCDIPIEKKISNECIKDGTIENIFGSNGLDVVESDCSTCSPFYTKQTKHFLAKVKDKEGHYYIYAFFSSCPRYAADYRQSCLTGPNTAIFRDAASKICNNLLTPDHTCNYEDFVKTTDILKITDKYQKLFGVLQIIPGSNYANTELEMLKSDNCRDLFTETEQLSLTESCTEIDSGIHVKYGQIDKTFTKSCSNDGKGVVTPTCTSNKTYEETIRECTNGTSCIKGECVNGNTNNLKGVCENSGGIWGADACTNSCGFKEAIKDGLQGGCNAIFIEGCDCGQNKCWTGDSCRPLNEN